MYGITLCIYCRKTDEEINNYVSSVPVDCIKTSIFVIHTSALKARDDVSIFMSDAMENNRVQ